MSGARWNISTPNLEERAPHKLEAPQSSMELVNKRELNDCRSYVNTRSIIIKVKLMFNDSTSQRMEKEHLTKLAPTSQ